MEVVLGYYPGHVLYGQMESTEAFNQNSRYSSRDLNRVPPEYRSGIILLFQFAGTLSSFLKKAQCCKRN
jgi:hypothetical protein